MSNPNTAQAEDQECLHHEPPDCEGCKAAAELNKGESPVADHAQDQNSGKLLETMANSKIEEQGGLHIALGILFLIMIGTMG